MLEKKEIVLLLFPTQLSVRLQAHSICKVKINARKKTESPKIQIKLQREKIKQIKERDIE